MWRDRNLESGAQQSRARGDRFYSLSPRFGGEGWGEGGARGDGRQPSVPSSPSPLTPNPSPPEAGERGDRSFAHHPSDCRSRSRPRVRFMDMPAARGPVPVVPGVLFGAAVLAAAVWWFWDPEPVRARPQDWALQDPRNPAYSTDPDDPFPMPPELVGVNLLAQSDADRDRKSTGCVDCHENTGDPHGKDDRSASAAPTATAATPTPPTRTRPTSRPRYPEAWPTSANPVRVLHAAQPRVARVRPLRQPRRPAHRPHQLRHGQLPPEGGAARTARA